MTRTEQRAETRRRLLEVGARMFKERGYAATRSADVAEAAGVTTGAFFNHFPTKQAFLLEALAHAEAERTGWYDLPRQLDPATPLAEVVGTAMGAMRPRGDTSSWTRVITEFLFHEDRPEVREIVTATYEGWIDEIERMVIALQDGGWVDPTRPARPLAVHLFTVGEGHRVVAEVYGGGDPADLANAIVATLAGP
jgi:AcrR family transcriptional regulator